MHFLMIVFCLLIVIATFLSWEFIAWFTHKYVMQAIHGYVLHLTSGPGYRIARQRASMPAALVATFSYDSRVLLERHIDGRDLAVSILDGEPLPGGGGRAEWATASTTSRRATRSAAPSWCVPAELPDGADGAGAGARAADLPACLAAPPSGGWT